MKCKLCEVLEKEKKKFLYEDTYCAILPTKNMKGHHKRIMIVTKFHVKELTKEMEEKLTYIFQIFCEQYFDEEPTYALVDSTYATIPEHWHKIACDWYGTPDEMKQLHYTPHTAIKTKVRWSP